MTSSVENDPDALKICPYDPVHKVKAKRFPYHLEKCRKVRKSNITEFLALTHCWQVPGDFLFLYDVSRQIRPQLITF